MMATYIRDGVCRLNFICSVFNRYLRINLSSGKVLRLRMKLSQMFEEVQRAYMEFCRKEARK